MIKNSKQLTLTKRRIEEFSNAINVLEKQESTLPPLLQKAQRDALVCQKEELEEQAAVYEQLLSGEFAVFDVENIADLPKALIMSRISMGLTQKDLAERLGMKEQQIQRYEDTEYSSASFSKLVSIVEALDLKITEDVFLPKESRVKNILLEKLKDAGLEKGFIDKRIAPRDVSCFDFSAWVDGTINRLSTIFGWSKELLLCDAPLAIGRDASMVARFKMPAGANEQYASAYTQYAFYLANIVAESLDMEQKEISSDAKATRDHILNNYGEVSFNSILAYAAELGVPVIPLNDSGAFHGATWRIKGKNVIVLKQKSAFASKWSFDLLHELYHASQRPELSEFSVVELSETSDERRNDQEERDANKFASEVLLGEGAEDYVKQCLEKAQGKIAWLKNAVIQVAETESLDCGVLAYQVASKVSNMQASGDRKINWWGAANNLQASHDNPKALCRDSLLKSLSLDRLNTLDRNIIEQAFSL